MNVKLITIFLTTVFVLLVLSILISKLTVCYPGFTIDLKTPGDRCDLAYVLLRIGYLPHALVVFIGIFLSLRVLKRNIKTKEDKN